ncbi:MAG: hypothetical protein IBX60_07475 [Candidatus Aminicenantes bacterium]|nr:hypothetical protein [Candidatus Aminicenantes bacterium]
MMLKSHLFSMVLYAVLVCIVLALIRRNEPKAQLKYGISLFIIMVVGGIIFGWLMYLFMS